MFSLSPAHPQSSFILSVDFQFFKCVFHFLHGFVYFFFNTSHLRGKSFFKGMIMHLNPLFVLVSLFLRLPWIQVCKVVPTLPTFVHTYSHTFVDL